MFGQKRRRDQHDRGRGSVPKGQGAADIGENSVSSLITKKNRQRVRERNEIISIQNGGRCEKSKFLFGESWSEEEWVTAREN